MAEFSGRHVYCLEGEHSELLSSSAFYFLFYSLLSIPENSPRVPETQCSIADYFKKLKEELEKEAYWEGEVQTGMLLVMGGSRERSRSWVYPLKRMCTWTVLCRHPRLCLCGFHNSKVFLFIHTCPWS